MKHFCKCLGGGLAAFAILALAVGCGPEGPKAPKGDAKKEGKKEAKGHAHGAGPHGGAVADWGGGKYHIEFTVDHDKQEATVYILGSDEETAVPIKSKDGQLSASIKGVKNKDAFELVLKASPQKDDPEGKASRFVGKHEKIGVVQEFEGTIIGEVDGTPYTGDFKEEPEPKK